MWKKVTDEVFDRKYEIFNQLCLINISVKLLTNVYVFLHLRGNQYDIFVFSNWLWSNTCYRWLTYLLRNLLLLMKRSLYCAVTTIARDKDFVMKCLNSICMNKTILRSLLILFIFNGLSLNSLKHWNNLLWKTLSLE